MLLTEEEARAKWCPHAADSNTGGNRVRYGSHDFDPQYGSEAAIDFPCIASDCMAWRSEINMNSGIARGYCGLAGKP